jgi:amylovoran biosynthesis glycosyltransferase AmsE
MSALISVLVSVYCNNTEFEVRRCFDSLKNQIYRPSEVVVVVDGPINIDIKSIFGEYDGILLFKPMYLEKNVGLGSALNVGLEHCSYDYVARIDIDDVCKPDRLFLQKRFLDLNRDVSVLGGQVHLFDDNGIYANRLVPNAAVDINRHSLYRNPMNHSTVMYRRDKIINVGGYPDVRFTQDYLLWINCINNGLVLYNIPDFLCEMYADKNMRRRRGLSYLAYDLKPYVLNFKLGRSGFFTLILMATLRCLFNGVNSVKSVF